MIVHKNITLQYNQMCVPRPLGLRTLSSHGSSAFEFGREYFIHGWTTVVESKIESMLAAVALPCLTPTSTSPLLYPHGPFPLSPQWESLPVGPHTCAVPPRAWPCQAQQLFLARRWWCSRCWDRVRPTSATWRGWCSTCHNCCCCCHRQRRHRCILLPILLLRPSPSPPLSE